MSAEPRIPRHRFYAKENHVQLAREDKDKSVIRQSGIDRIDGGVDLAGQVEAILAGTGGFVLDPSDFSTLFQDNGAATPVTATGQTVGRMLSKWGNIQRSVSQATVPARPVVLPNGRLGYDGADDRLVLTNTNLMQAVPAATIISSMRFGSLGGRVAPYHVSNGLVAGAQRMSLIRDVGDQFLATQRRLDADTITALSSGAASVPVAQDLTISHDCDFAGSGLTRLWQNGVLLGSATLTGAAAPSENTASLTFTVGCRNTIEFFLGELGRFFYAPFLLTAEQRATVAAWVEEA